MRTEIKNGNIENIITEKDFLKFKKIWRESKDFKDESLKSDKNLCILHALHTVYVMSEVLEKANQHLKSIRGI